MERSRSISARTTTLLVDLDGTLVQMRRRGIELQLLFRALKRFYPIVPPWRFTRAFWGAVHIMQNHQTSRPNYRVFLEELLPYRWGNATLDDAERVTRAFIAEDFATLAPRFSPIPGARETLLRARRRGYRLVLATNPVWPLAAVRMRLSWGGIEDTLFDFISHSEIMTRCKPNPEYYTELLDRIQEAPERCLMIGNDPRKDLPAHDAGIPTFLLGRDGSWNDLNVLAAVEESA